MSLREHFRTETHSSVTYYMGLEHMPGLVDWRVLIANGMVFLFFVLIYGAY